MSANTGSPPPHHNLMMHPAGYSPAPGSVHYHYPAVYGTIPGSVHYNPPRQYLSSAAAPATAETQSYHDQLQRDFVSLRYRSLNSQSLSQQLQQPPSSGSDSIWRGVSDMERLLVSCCCSHPSEDTPTSDGEHNAVAQTTISTNGALDRDLVLRFVTILAIHCHDVGSRALALAILERSLEQDALEETAAEERALEADILLGSIPGSVSVHGDDEGDAVAPHVARSDDEQLLDEPSPKRKKLKPEPDEADEKPSTVEPRSSRRIHEFLAAGGMRILNQWLIEASTPVDKPIVVPGSLASATTASARPKGQPTRKEASPTGPILIPLLQFLSSVPFDLKLIKKSKINKQIRALSKEMDSLATDLQAGDNATHVASGGLPIRQVKGEVDRLKEAWEQKANEGNSKRDLRSTLNPLGQLQKQLMERLGVLESYSSGGGDAGRDGSNKPEWLVKVEEQQRAKEKKKASKTAKLITAASTADLARRERENERAALMREDLQKAQEQRRQLVIKLRELKQKSLQEEQKARHSENKRSIRWKDGWKEGGGQSSKARKRDLLEEVFIIPGRGMMGEEGDDEAGPDEDLDTDDVIEVL